MEIFLALVVLAVIAAAAFVWMRSRQDGAPGLSGRASGLRGPRRARAAARHDPMAEVVEQHAIATEPRAAAEAELRLQAQARRVASDLHARQAATRDAGSADEHREPVVYEDGRPVAYEDGQ